MPIYTGGILYGFLFLEFHYSGLICAFSAASAKVKENVLAFCYHARVKMNNYVHFENCYIVNGNWFPFVQIDYNKMQKKNARTRWKCWGR